MAVEFSPLYARSGARAPGAAHVDPLSWRVALTLIANGSVILWVVIMKAVMLLTP